MKWTGRDKEFELRFLLGLAGQADNLFADLVHLDHAGRAARRTGEAIAPMPSTAKMERRLLLPTATQLLLLRAALGDGRAACDSFAAWKKATGYANYDEIDFASTRHLPMVYRNLACAGHDDPWMNKLVGLHRYHWIQNAGAQQRLLEIAAAFNDGGTQFVAVGGLALWAGHYIDDLGERPMLNGEFLVSNADAPKIRQSLMSLGWRTATRMLPPIAGWQSEWWQSTGRPLVRINFRWLPKPYPVLRLERLLAYAEAAEIASVPLRIPDATDQLLYACVGNRQWRADDAHRTIWVADALRILQRSGSRIDWDRFYLDATLLRSVATLHESLAYLQRHFELESPAGWTARATETSVAPEPDWPNPRSGRRSIWSRLVETATVAHPWQDYVAAEQTARREPSAAAWLQYCGWRVRCELSRAFSARRKGSAANHR
jgi:hypothetical protein